MGKSKIEWTTDTWNPIRASNLKTNKIGWFCVHESEGCRNCYAEAINFRLGTGVDYMAQRRDQVEIFLDEKMLTAPLHWKKPRMIFVCSMTDLFGIFVTDEMIDRMFAVMALTPQHTYQVLTKRPQRMREYCSQQSVRKRLIDCCRTTPTILGGRKYARRATDLEIAIEVCRDEAERYITWPLPNVWLGTSCEDQKAADARIPHLLATPADVRFLSCEPLLGRISLHHIGKYTGDSTVTMDALDLIDWVIIGGESGPDARVMRYSWALSLVNQCANAEISCFVKQMGAKPIDDLGVRLKSRKGSDPEEWPEQLRVREMP